MSDHYCCKSCHQRYDLCTCVKKNPSNDSFDSTGVSSHPVSVRKRRRKVLTKSTKGKRTTC